MVLPTVGFKRKILMNTPLVNYNKLIGGVLWAFRIKS